MAKRKSPAKRRSEDLNLLIAAELANPLHDKALIAESLGVAESRIRLVSSKISNAHDRARLVEARWQHMISREFPPDMQFEELTSIASAKLSDKNGRAKLDALRDIRELQGLSAAQRRGRAEEDHFRPAIVLPPGTRVSIDLPDAGAGAGAEGRPDGGEERAAAAIDITPGPQS